MWHLSLKSTLFGVDPCTATGFAAAAFGHKKNRDELRLKIEKTEPKVGLEPTTHALRKRCSTN